MCIDLQGHSMRGLRPLARSVMLLETILGRNQGLRPTCSTQRRHLDQAVIDSVVPETG